MLTRVIFVAAIFSTLAAPAFAQSEMTRSAAREAQDIFEVSNKESDYFEHIFRGNTPQSASAYNEALRFATCATKLNHRAAASVLASDAGTAKETGALRELTRRQANCAITRASLSPVFVRGAIAESLWKSAGANPNPAGRNTVALDDVEAFIKAAPLGEQRVKSANLPLSLVSRCQVMALPADAAKVLQAIPGSKDELAAAEALYRNSKVCGVANGLENTSALVARAGLADAFYQDGLRVKMASAR